MLERPGVVIWNEVELDSIVDPVVIVRAVRCVDTQLDSSGASSKLEACDDRQEIQRSRTRRAATSPGAGLCTSATRGRRHLGRVGAARLRGRLLRRRR